MTIIDVRKIKGSVVVAEIESRETVEEKDLVRRKMALNEATERVRLGGRSRCALSSESHTKRKSIPKEV